MLCYRDGITELQFVLPYHARRQGTSELLAFAADYIKDLEVRSRLWIPVVFFNIFVRKITSTTIESSSLVPSPLQDECNALKQSLEDGKAHV